MRFSILGMHNSLDPSPHLTSNGPYRIEVILLFSAKTKLERPIPFLLVQKFSFPTFCQFLIFKFSCLWPCLIWGTLHGFFLVLELIISDVRRYWFASSGCPHYFKFSHHCQKFITISVGVFVDLYFLSPIVLLSSHLPSSLVDVAEFACIYPLILYIRRHLFLFLMREPVCNMQLSFLAARCQLQSENS